MIRMQCKSVKKPHWLPNERKSYVKVIRVHRSPTQININKQQQTNNGSVKGIEPIVYLSSRNEARVFSSSQDQLLPMDIIQQQPSNQNNNMVDLYPNILHQTNDKHVYSPITNIQISTSSSNSNIIYPSSNTDITGQQKESRIYLSRSITKTKATGKINGRHVHQVCPVCSKCCGLVLIPFIILLLIGLTAMSIGLSNIGETASITITMTVTTSTCTTTTATTVTTSTSTTSTSTSSTSSTSTSSTTSTSSSTSSTSSSTSSTSTSTTSSTSTSSTSSTSSSTSSTTSSTSSTSTSSTSSTSTSSTTSTSSSTSSTSSSTSSTFTSSTSSTSTSSTTSTSSSTSSTSSSTSSTSTSSTSSTSTSSTTSTSSSTSSTSSSSTSSTSSSSTSSTSSSTSSTSTSSATSTSTSSTTETSTSSTTSTSTSSATSTSTSSTSTTSTTTTTTTTVHPCGVPVYRGATNSIYSSSTGGSSYTCYYFEWIASTTGSVTLAFQFQNTPNYWYMDDVSVSNGTAEMLLNGGFELGSFSPGWTTSMPNGNCAVTANAAQVISSSCRTGSYCVLDGCGLRSDQIAQSFMVTTGQTYFISFWLKLTATGTGISVSVALS